MSKGQLVITAAVLGGRSKSEVSRDYDVSRFWVQQLVRRYETEGAAAFEPHPRRPHRNPRAVDTALEDTTVRLRKTLDKQGYDAGAGHHRRTPHPRPQRRQRTCGIHDLADPVSPRVRHTTAPEAATLGVETLPSRITQSMLASR